MGAHAIALNLRHNAAQPPTGLSLTRGAIALLDLRDSVAADKDGSTSAEPGPRHVGRRQWCQALDFHRLRFPQLSYTQTIDYCTILRAAHGYVELLLMYNL